MARILREASSLFLLAFGLAAFVPQAFAQEWDLIVSKSGPSQVAPGDTITYSIGLANLGPDAATGVSLSDALPAGTTFVSFAQNAGPPFTCSVPAVGTGGTVTCTIAGLFAPGSGVSFTLVVDTDAVPEGTLLTNIASVLSDSDVGAENDSAVAVTLVGAFADLEVVKTGTASILEAGGLITYGITLANNGPDGAQSVSLSDTIPGGTTFVSFTQGSGPAFSCSTPAVGGGGTITCTIATLAAGANASFTLVVDAAPALEGTTITNTATATSTTVDPDAGNNSGSAFTVVTAPNADVAVTKIGPSTVVAGANVTYTIFLSNNGPQDAQSVTLTDDVPPGTTFVSLASPGGFSCTTPAVGGVGTVTCSIALLASGASAPFTLVVQSSAAGAGTTITNTVSASTTAVDPGPGNNSATAFTLVVPPSADLAVTKTAPAAVSPGATISYAIGLANNGPEAAQSVALSDTLPPGTTFVSLTSAPGFSCTTPAVGGSGTVTCSIATLASGSAAAFTLVIQTGIGSAGATITNTASASSTTADPNPANNSASAMTSIVAVASLVVSKAGPASVPPGTNISYSIGLVNNGPDAAQSTVLTDVLPAGTTFVSLTPAPGFSCTTPAVGGSGTVSCSIASLAPGASASFTLVVLAGPATAGTTVTNTATVTSATVNPSPAGTSASAMTGVGTSADLAVTKTGPATAPSGTNLTYNIVLANSGPSAALTTALTDALPAGTTFVSLAQTSGPAFTCTTPAVGAGGTVSCSIASLASTASAAFTLVARAGPATAATTITNTASASSATTDPNPANNSSSALTVGVASQTFSGPSATGSGTITATFTGGGPGCTYANAEFIPVTGHPRSPPAGSAPARVTFPHGLFDFTISGCTPAATLLFTIEYPAVLPAGTQYWKYGPRPGVPAPEWYVLPATVSGNTATFTITDGGIGDDDLAPNGTIVDQGGPGVPPVIGDLRQVPTLSEWMQVLLAALILALGMAGLRRRPARIGG